MWVGVCRVPGNEERRWDTLTLEQPQDTLAPDRTELPREMMLGDLAA
jgi:hypothetical protein